MGFWEFIGIQGDFRIIVSISSKKSILELHELEETRSNYLGAACISCNSAWVFVLISIYINIIGFGFKSHPAVSGG